MDIKSLTEADIVGRGAMLAEALHKESRLKFLGLRAGGLLA